MTQGEGHKLKRKTQALTSVEHSYIGDVYEHNIRLKREALETKEHGSRHAYYKEEESEEDETRSKRSINSPG